MKVGRVDTVPLRTPAPAAMAAVDVTRAEFEALMKRVSQVEAQVSETRRRQR